MNTHASSPAAGPVQSKRLPSLRWKWLLAVALAATFAIAGFAPSFLVPAAHAQAAPPPAAPVRPDRILVKPKVGVTLGVNSAELTTLHRTTGVQVLRTFASIQHWQVLELPAGADAATVLAAYRRSGLVHAAEPDFKVSILAEPNDFRFGDGSLWGLRNTGLYGGTPGADISAVAGWDIQNTASNIIVAVVDTGVRLTHEDLAANLWVNPGEIPGNGIDDDGNGFIDDVHGINAILNTGVPLDDHGHGTHVSGILGAVGSNTVGVVGVCWRVQIMACKFLDPTPQGSISDAIQCIDYARSKGAKIINASWGATNYNSQALRDAIISARDAGILFIAAAGNSHEDNGVNPIYPASFQYDNILSVAATTRTDELATFSNYGATTVHLAAPGSPVFSCWKGSDSDYRYLDGTSMAAPHVSGACALLWARYPTETHQQIVQRVLLGTDPVPSLAGKCITGGRLNLAKALMNGETYAEWSTRYFGTPTADQNADPDGDGATNYAEYRAGTSPTSNQSVFRFLGVGPNAQGGVTIQWLSVTNRLYAVERSTNLNLPMSSRFTVLQTHYPASGTTNSFQDTTATGAGRFFYRIRVE